MMQLAASDLPRSTYFRHSSTITPPDAAPHRRGQATACAGEGRSIDEATRDYLAARQPTGRFVAMERVGAMVAFLCSAAAQDITGASLPIDGGWSIA